MGAAIVGCARVASDGRVTQIDGKATAPEIVTESEVQEPAKLARLLGRLVVEVAALRRRFAPRRTDFEDCVVTNPATILTLEHSFGGRVRWWIVDQTSAMMANQTADTTADTLVLSVYGDADGTCTVRIEEAG